MSEYALDPVRRSAYAWNVGVPVVEGHKVLGEGSQDRDLLFGVVVHDLLSQEGVVGLF